MPKDVEVEKPLNKVSPHILHKISVKYGISYEDLMRKAGYLIKKKACNHEFNGMANDDKMCKKCGVDFFDLPEIKNIKFKSTRPKPVEVGDGEIIKSISMASYKYYHSETVDTKERFIAKSLKSKFTILEKK